ncbi:MULTISPECIES: L-threonylcarbamoyladenylate synthase [Sphingobium]|uniref:Threonylcarbamoyl-AMP synthase n=1 Tax=Sphingobium limneticum TaxID=1007511 RepID=A0A5J5IBH9_9SPHN|nr:MULTISPECIES: L-threonylcarbamoyladenylate synthase [Sphingobium]KAA9020062.1 threonylcarbamoyl-AMP synthase [Sphingobium limneticum]KAA9021458.1 threonylcarbamoyl-AMP synthase [Sphingobium limneticum]KAA9033820.1 threonylcarbamoyl-AMP synthase [Sphingobium limneticum]BBD03293.1 L-threonylcarbamoyladenylate synthase [Sphingobium sp. YG1]
MTIAHPVFSTKSVRYGSEALREAALLIRAGEPVAVPTETVYGLAADATDTNAVAAIYSAKGRPSFNPLIVHVADRAMAERLADISPSAALLADRFWPGPLTLVLPVRADSGLSPLVTAGLPTVALRLPAHPAMRALIRESGCPLAAPSANRSGSISPTRADHVLASLDGKIRMILDEGPTSEGLESTIAAPEQDRIRLLRPGPVTAAMLEEATSLPVVIGGDAKIEAPGQLESHYAPSKPVRLNALRADKDEYLIGFGLMPCHINLSQEADLREAAAQLFAALHIADAAASSRIAVAPIPSDGIGAAINDRLRRAAA